MWRSGRLDVGLFGALMPFLSLSARSHGSGLRLLPGNVVIIALNTLSVSLRVPSEPG